jgi:hypothetical protein
MMNYHELNLELTNWFLFSNDVQGNVSCFETFAFEYEIGVPVNLPIGEEAIRITGVRVFTNYSDSQRFPEVVDVAVFVVLCVAL